jgi:DNA-binding IclR family transcriptional regulator
VSVARTSSAIATLLELADGRKTMDDLAREAGLRPAELEATLDELVEIGAVRFSTGS